MIGDVEFQALMNQKAKERSAKVAEVRTREREERVAKEEEFITITTLLKSFRDYTFIVLQTRSKNYLTIRSDSSYNTVKNAIESLEKHYMDTGELLYKVFRTFIDEGD
jgi:hypothetical protein